MSHMNTLSSEHPLSNESTLIGSAMNPKHYPNLPICFSRSAASSFVALGIIPGSVQLVCSKNDITNKNRSIPATGIAGLKCTAKYGQLQQNSTENDLRTA